MDPNQIENPDHYRYMPRPKGETPEAAESEAAEEVLVTETVVEEIVIRETEPTEEPKTEETSLNPEEEEDAFKISPLWKTLAKGTLKFFYDVLNPYLIPAYATLLIFELSVFSMIAPGAALPYTLTVLGATCVLPVIALVILLRIHSIESLGLDRRGNRLFPYIIEFLALAAMTIFFAVKGAVAWLWLIYCGATTTVLLNMLINFKIKVSNHCSAIAALLAVLIVIRADGLPHHSLGWWALGTVMAAGILGTAAMVLGRHKLQDVIIGYATGFLPIILFSLIY